MQVHPNESVPVFQAKPPSAASAITYLNLVLESSQLSNGGAQLQELERRLAAMLDTDAELVVCFSSCTMALAAALSSYNEESVIVPDYTFIGTLRSAQLAMKRVDVCDVQSETAEAEYGEVDGQIKLFVAPFGAWRDSYLSIEGSTVFDCAASLGAMPNLSGLTSNQVVCFSLHATKVLGSGEGGFAVFGSRERASFARQWLNFGIDPEITQGSRNLGANGKMSEIQAAFILGKIDDWASEDEEWSRLRKIALSTSEDLGLDASLTAEGHSTPYWIVRMDSANEAKLVSKSLSSMGVETRSWWPVSIATVAGESERANSTDLRGKVLGLPFFLGISESERSRVNRALDLALRDLAPESERGTL